MLIYLITLAFMLFSIRNYRKSFFVIFILGPLLAQFKSPIGSMNLFALLSVFNFFLIVLFTKWHFSLMKRFPIKMACVAITASLFLSNYFSHDQHFVTMLVTIVVQVLNVFFFWYLITEKKECLPFVMKVIFCFASVLALYALFETVTRTNAYINLVNYLDLYTNKTYVSEIRYGLKRSQSMFSMHTTNGGVVFLLFFVLMSAKNCSFFKNREKQCSIILMLLLCTVFFCGARSAIIGFMIAVLSLFNKDNVKTKVFFPMLLLVLFVISFGALDYISNVFASISNTETVNGSSTEMRSLQFDVTGYYLKRNFWFGNGLAYTWNVALQNFKTELLGAESLWIPIAIDQGFIGISSYVILLISMIWYAIVKQKKMLVFFVTGFWVFNSMSSIPCVNITYLFIYLFLIIEIGQKSKFCLKAV